MDGAKAPLIKDGCKVFKKFVVGDFVGPVGTKWERQKNDSYFAILWVAYLQSDLWKQ